MKKWLFGLVMLISSVTFAKGNAVLLYLQGTIGPASAEYVQQGFSFAQKENAELIFLQIDTPGGLSTVMREIIQEIVNSPIPVVSYVTPLGARAASAGTYILYASHIAAMAPATNLGAATPIPMAMPNTPNEAPQTEAPKHKKAMTNKAVNDAAAYLRGLAELRGRNGSWSENAVREGASLSASEALEDGVIDIVADSVPNLLEQLNNRTVTVKDSTITLNTTDIQVTAFEPSLRLRILATITDPNIAYIFMMIGIYGLIFELANPGFVLPGMIGGISLVIALYAMHLLPVNYTGLSLMVLGIGFMISESFFPGFGVLGIGGILTFAAGSFFLMDSSIPGFTIAWPSIISVTAITAFFFINIVGMAICARQRKPLTGSEQIVGSFAIALEDFDGGGFVQLGGERWKAHADTHIQAGQTVIVTEIDGLTVFVRPYNL